MSDFSSGHDLTVGEFEPHVGLTAISVESSLDPRSPTSLSAPPLLMLSLSKINKTLTKKERKKEKMSCYRAVYPIKELHRGVVETNSFMV